MLRSIILLLVAAAPSAAADVEVHDESFGQAGCANPGDFYYGETSATVAEGDLYARGGGSRFCYNDAENGQFSASQVFANADGPTGWSYVAWSGSAGSCNVYVAAAGQSAFQPCPAQASPPDPGWGELLP